MDLPALMLCFVTEMHEQGGTDVRCHRTDLEIDTVLDWSPGTPLDGYQDGPGCMSAGYRSDDRFVPLISRCYDHRSYEGGGTERTYVVVDTDVVFRDEHESPVVSSVWPDWR